jgi:hypothetical protein
MPDFGSDTFSQTDANNATGNMPSWNGAAAPSTIDDAGRALQGAVTREWNWRSFTLTAGGTADSKTLTYSVAPAAYYNGQRFAFIANTTNTGAVTLNINTLGAKAVRKVLAGTPTALAAGDMVSGARVEVAYNLAADAFDLVIANDLKANLAGGNTFTGDQTVNSGTFRLNASFPAYHFFPTTGTANQRAFRIQADNGNLTFIGVDDSNNQQNFPFQIAWGGNATFNTSALIVSPVSGIGYGTGSGGSVTQTTSKSTTVTLNKPSGVIVMNNAALAAGASVQFTLNNSVIFSTDVLLLTVTGNTFTGYRVEPVNILTGQAGIRVTNVTGSTLSDALTINFAILRCATS